MEKFEVGLQNLQKWPCFAYAEVNGKTFLVSEEQLHHSSREYFREAQI